MYACVHQPDAAAVAESFSPFVEILDDRTAVFAITPRQLERIKKLPRAAVAETVEAAVMAARNFEGVSIFPKLGRLPVDALADTAAADPEVFEIFDRWGIRTLDDLARLPETGLAGRLGVRGVELQRLARGVLERPLKPAAIETVYEERIELDYAITQIEPLLFLINRFLTDICARLDAQSLAAGALDFRFNQETRLLRLPFPTRAVKFLLKIVQHELESHPLASPPHKIRLKIVPAASRRVQHGLFTPAAPEPEKLELTLQKIRAMVGAKNVKIPELRNSYRPGWSLPDSPLAFRYFRPPIPAQVELENGVPAKLFQKTIVNIAGPWRSSGEWWLDGRWNRDEWDLKLADGTLFRVFRAEKWFLEGIYD